MLPSDCDSPPAKCRTGLYLRTSRDLAAARVWSRPTTILENLPPDTLIPIGRVKDMPRWVVRGLYLQPPRDDARRPSLRSLPALQSRSLVRLDRRPGAVRRAGYGGGRFDRGRFYWMTDRYGNLDTPTTYPTKGGLLTWFDRLAPRSDGSPGPWFYGRQIFWSTWTVRPR